MEEATVFSSWQVIGGRLDSVVDLVLDTEAGSARSEESPSHCVVLEPSVDSGSCEVTVEFKHTLCIVRSIHILSSFRRCEVYYSKKAREEAEYLCTARGELQSSTETGCELFKSEIELVNAEPWAGFRVKLLSLLSSSQAIIEKITIFVARSTPTPTTDGAEQRNRSNNSELMTMMMPGMLQMLRGLSNGAGRRQTQAAAEQAAVTGTQSEVRPAQQTSKEDDDNAKKLASEQAQVQKKETDERFQKEVSSRLQKLETVVGGMESYLHIAFGKLDDRLGNLEKQISALQIQPHSRAEDAVCTTEIAAAAATIDQILEDADNLEATSNKEGSALDREASDDLESLITARQSSVSLEDAWSSALAAFSVSAGLELAVADDVNLPQDPKENVEQPMEEEEIVAAEAQKLEEVPQTLEGGQLTDDYIDSNLQLVRDAADSDRDVTSSENLVEPSADADDSSTVQVELVKNPEGSSESITVKLEVRSSSRPRIDQLDLIDWSSEEAIEGVASSSAEASQSFSLSLIDSIGGLEDETTNGPPALTQNG